MATRKPSSPLIVESLRHDDASRVNIPTAEHRSVVPPEVESPVRAAYARRNRDLDPQLVWRGKDVQDWSDLVVHAPPLYIQEKIHPKALIDDLRRATERARAEAAPPPEQVDLFADFNGLPSEDAKTEFYRHEGHWANRMILGDSLQVMASLAEREGLRGKVQCIYLDPPYGIRFNSNFQWSTTSRDVKDGATDHITREPEQVKAFRDTWRDGIHSYLTYLRDRLTVARELLTESGSIFVQIGDENVHRVRAVMDEVFGAENIVAQIQIKKSGGATSQYLAGITDFVLWYAKSFARLKYRPVFLARDPEGKGGGYNLFESSEGFVTVATEDQLRAGLRLTDGRLLQQITLTSQRQGRATGEGSAMGFPVEFEGATYLPAKNRGWTTTAVGIARLKSAGRIARSGSTLRYKRYFSDFAVIPTTDLWDDVQAGSAMDKVYVVQTGERVVERCVLMSTDPGDLVLDPTCGSGTTAYVAEQWGRRWITIDTSRVALALARARIMGARYPYYLLADSRDGQLKEAEVTRSAPSTVRVHGNVRLGFVYERVPHVTLKAIVSNAEIDVIWERNQAILEPLRERLNDALGCSWREWEIPRYADAKWSEPARSLHAQWWAQRIARQQEIDASIAARAEYEYLYDRPYEDRRKVRVAGPFTVESLSPHRTLAVGEDDQLIDPARTIAAEPGAEYLAKRDFVQIVLEHLRTAGVQQARKSDRVTFTSLVPWPGNLICAEGKYEEAGAERRAGVFVGPEFGTVSRADLVVAAREAGDADFDVVIACAFNYEAHASEFDKLGRIPVLKARMNADLHMAEDLKNTGKGNLFVVFGEPDIDVLTEPDGRMRVKVNGVDVFHPATGEVRSDGPEGIACWLVDTDYDEESFFVRHAYFLGANDPYKSLKTTLKAEIDADGWASLNSDTSRPFEKPRSGRIAVKVINHLGDEVMKVFRAS
jgi:adenine-specific DNA-methyltransferase